MTDQPFKTHLFEYRHDGKVWGLEIMAQSEADAKDRLKALAWAQYQGELVMKIPVPGGGIVRKVLAWLGF